MVKPYFTPDLAKSAGLDETRFPKGKVEIEAAEEVLSKDLAELSLHEHEKCVFDVHGFEEAPDEDPIEVESKLRQLEQVVDKINQKPAYDRALFFHKSYVTGRAFRLMFLRGTSFDVPSASAKMLKHFEMKRRLFGDNESLARDIRRSDLTEKAIDILDSGILMHLKTRDSNGRAVFLMRTLYEGLPYEDLNRAFWYSYMTLLQEEETQKRGVVVISFNFNNWRSDMDFIKAIDVRDGIPGRAVGIHYCYSDDALTPMVTGLLLYLDRDTRARFRPHLGSVDEILFQLQTYGIPINDGPLQPDGTWSLEPHRQWLRLLEHRETRDQERMNNLGIIIPGRFDVLFGKTKSAKEHTGNLRLLHLCEMNFKEYNNSTKSRKTEISDRLISIVHESHGRFLKWTEKDGWVETDWDSARDKIAHLFRHRRFRVCQEEATRSSVKRATPT